MICRMNITPLEPYTFGNDSGFKRKGEESIGKETYYMRSKKIPEQTTILGMLRYQILEQQELLKSSFGYDQDNQKKMAKYIGKGSFSFRSDEKQQFGCIQSISPIFLMDQDGNYYVKNPYCNKKREEKDVSGKKVTMEYTPMKIEGNFTTSYGKISLPGEKEFEAKEGHASGYYNLSNGLIVEEQDLFKTHTFVGNRKNSSDPNKEDGFYKREVITLKEGFSFAVFIEFSGEEKEKLLKADCNQVPMGYRKSLFKTELTVNIENDLCKYVENAFSAWDSKWYYALSDLIVENVNHESFCVVESKQIRNLETNINHESNNKRIQKSSIQYNLIESGSVFYCDGDETKTTIANMIGETTISENVKQIGYNHIVQIGGK